MLLIAFAVAVFLGAYFEVAKMGFERLANEGGAVPLSLTGGTIRGHQELLVENDLDCFHDVDSTPQYTPHIFKRTK